MDGLVEYFNNGYAWKKPSGSSGHGGEIGSEGETGMKTKSAKQKTALRHVSRPNPSLLSLNIIAKTYLKDLY